MQWTDDLTIETPEQIDVSLEIAGLGSRFVAQVLDWLIKGLMLGVLLVLVLVLASLLGTEFTDRSPSPYLLALGVGLGYAIVLGFDIYYEARHNGQTPGKKFAGIRVIREGGGPLDFRAACIRNLLGTADLLPAFYLLGALIVLLSARGQRLGDMAAGTIVIRERALEPPADLAGVIEKLASKEFSFTPTQLAACAAEDRYLLRSFFQRYPDMEQPARGQLARKLADEFVRKTAWQPTTPINDGRRAMAFLASLYRDIEDLARHEG
jgi:uncharacterized RDD family membrane protein YckC